MHRIHTAGRSQAMLPAATAHLASSTPRLLFCIKNAKLKSKSLSNNKINHRNGMFVQFISCDISSNICVVANSTNSNKGIFTPIVAITIGETKPASLLILFAKRAKNVPYQSEPFSRKRNSEHHHYFLHIEDKFIDQYPTKKIK